MSVPVTSPILDRKQFIFRAELVRHCLPLELWLFPRRKQTKTKQKKSQTNKQKEVTQVLCLNVKLCIFLAMLNLCPLQSPPYPSPHQDSGFQIIVEKKFTQRILFKSKKWKEASFFKEKQKSLLPSGLQFSKYESLQLPLWQFRIFLKWPAFLKSGRGPSSTQGQRW